MTLERKALFNEEGDISTKKRRLIGGNTTNLNDFNNIKYSWTSDWYRQAMNNFWIPEEINLSTDVKHYRELEPEEKEAYDKILSFLVFLDSLQMANLPNVSEYITANEVNLCLTVQAYQEAIHSQSYGYILDTICSPEERTEILYQWKDDPVLLERNKFIGDKYNTFYHEPTAENLAETLVANYILEGIYFYSGFMFFYALGRLGKMPGTVQEIRYINRDENTHLWLFRSILMELKREESHLFTEEKITHYTEMLRQGVEEEIRWADYVIADRIGGLTKTSVHAYLKYLGNLRARGLGFEVIYPGFEEEPESMRWVSEYSDPNKVKTDFFEAKPSAYSKSSVIEDDL